MKAKHRRRCAAKARFDTEGLARASFGATAGLTPYLCPGCNGWHLTSRGRESSKTAEASAREDGRFAVLRKRRGW